MSIFLDHGTGTKEWNAAHEALKADNKAWQSLHFDGIAHGGPAGLVEQRRCPAPSCGSTISRAISLHEAMERLGEHAAVHQRSLEQISLATQLARWPPKSRLESGPPRRRGMADERTMPEVIKALIEEFAPTLGSAVETADEAGARVLSLRHALRQIRHELRTLRWLAPLLMGASEARPRRIASVSVARALASVPRPHSLVEVELRVPA